MKGKELPVKSLQSRGKLRQKNDNPVETMKYVDNNKNEGRKSEESFWRARIPKTHIKLSKRIFKIIGSDKSNTLRISVRRWFNKNTQRL